MDALTTKKIKDVLGVDYSNGGVISNVMPAEWLSNPKYIKGV